MDANGNRTAFEYDLLNRPTKITEADPDGAGSLTSPITNLSYDAAGNMTKLVDARNNTTQLVYDVLNRISSRTNAIGGTSQLSYNGAGNLVVTKDELGRETRYRYDGRNRLVEVTNAAGGRRSMRYDSVNNLTASTDENGNTTRYAFDGRNRITKMTDALGNVSGMFYNGVDNLVSTTDANSHTTQFAFDELNRLTSVTDAKGGIQSFEYDKASNLLASVDELNRRTQMAYDARDRRITVTSPLGKVYSSTYDAASNVKSVSDGRNQKTQLDYDGLHRLIKRTDALGGVASYSYDALGNMVSMTDERNRVTQLAFDAINRRVTTTDPLNHASQRTYDAVGNVITSSDGLGQLTSFTYDLLNRQAKMTDARGGITSYNYDPAGNVLSLSDADNNQTLFAYDALNRMESDTNALNAVKSYSYDAVGNLQSLTDRNNRVRRFSYDELNREVKEEWLDATDNPIRTFTSTFDAASQLKTIGDPDSTYGYKYDIDGQLTSVANTGTPGVPDVVFGYNYDATGNQSSRTDTITSVLKGTNAYSFDALNRMTRITQSGNNVAAKRVDLSYDAASQLTGIARFSDLVGTQQVASSAYVYDNAGRLTNLTHQRNSIALDQYAWTFDAANRITHVTTPDGTTDYSYDSTNQLTAANHSAQTDESYSYDLNGNRTNPGNQTDANNRLKSDGTYNYQYDDEGNRISRTKIADREVTTYQWDYRNRLTQVTTKNAANMIQMKATYTYDVYDRRIAKIVDRDGAGPNEVATERFVYDGPHIALTFDGSGMQTHRFLHGPAIDQILADENQLGQILWPLTDNQGTVRDVIDSTGTLKDHIQYDSFGNILTRLDASIVLPFAYTGREFDKETGLYYYRARYFDSKTGSFISEDPIGFMGSSYHLSKYVRNNPINDSDPSGKIDLIFWLVVTPFIIYGGYKAKESITDVRDQARPLGNDQANIEWQRYLKAHPEIVSQYKMMTLEEQRIFMDSKQNRHEFFDPNEGMERILNTATFDYFCHDYAWANKKKIEVKDFLKDLSGHGFGRINREDLRVGDVVTYSNDVKQLNNPGHSSLVYRIDPDGTIWMRSKDVENSEFIHRLGNKGNSNYFRTAFGDELQYFRKITPAPEAPGAIQIFENQHQQLRDAMKD